MILQDFINQYQGQPNVGDTDANKGQCVGLIETWLDANGLSPDHIWGNAIDLINNANPKIFTVGNQWPAPRGSIVTFGQPYGQLSDGSYAGHTGISLGDGQLFQQNDPDGSTPHIKAYGQEGYLGYITAPQLTQQGGDMPLTADQVKYLYRSGLGREPMQSDVDGNTGKDPGQLINAISNSSERQQYQDFETNATYEGALQRPAEESALENARTQARVEFVDGVLGSDEAKQVTLFYQAGKEPANTTTTSVPIPITTPAPVVTSNPPANSAVPHPKVTAAGLGALLTSGLLWLLNSSGVTLSPEISGLATTAVAVVSGYLTSSS